MTVEEILTDTFTAHEHLAPDADQVLEEITRRIAGQPRRSAGRALTVTGAVLAVAGLAVAGALVGTSSSHRPTPAQSAPVLPMPVAPTTAAPQPVTVHLPGVLTIDPGWLPSPTARESVSAIGDGTQYRGYDMHVDGFDLYVLLTLTDQAALPTGNKRGVPHDLQVNGQPAREWAVDYWYTLAVQVNPRQVLTVDLENAEENGANANAATLTRMGRHVARTVRLDRHDMIKPYFLLTDLPTGAVVTSVDRTVGQGTTYQLAPVNAQNQQAPATVSYQFGGTGAPPTRKARQTHGSPAITAGRPVQGHPTTVMQILDGRYILTVDGIAAGNAITLVSGPGVPSLADLYQIADGIIWQG